MKKLLTIAMLLIGALCQAKKQDPFSFRDKYDNTQVSCVAIIPDSYDPSRLYTVIIAEGGDGEKIWGGSTSEAVQNLLSKDGQAACEFLKDPREYENTILVTMVVPYQPSELNGALLKGRLLSQVVAESQKRYRVKQFSMTGLSSGGADVWQYISAYPNSLYAACPISCWQYSQTAALNKAVATGGTLIWQVNSSHDPQIGDRTDENMSSFMGALKTLGLNGKMTVPDLGSHDAWSPIYKKTPVPCLSSNENTAKLDPFPDNIWLFLSGESPVIPPAPVVNAPLVPIGTGLKMAYSYTDSSTINGIGAKCTYSYTDKLTGKIDLTYTSEHPPVSGFPYQNFNLTISGLIQVPQADTYTFYVTSDDGSRLSIAEASVTNDWNNHSAITSQGSIQMGAGKCKINLSYYNACCDGMLRLEYSTPTVKRQLVPLEWLYTE
jgi:hypothetical protein